MGLRKSEAERQHLVLLAHRPRAGKAEALQQPQHGLEPPDRSSRRVEGLKAANPRHGSLDPEIVALDPLLQVLSDVMGPVAKDFRARFVRELRSAELVSVQL